MADLQTQVQIISRERWMGQMQINLRISWDHPLNSAIIVHQKCVKSIRYYDSLKSITLQNKVKIADVDNNGFDLTTLLKIRLNHSDFLSNWS